MHTHCNLFNVVSPVRIDERAIHRVVTKPGDVRCVSAEILARQLNVLALIQGLVLDFKSDHRHAAVLDWNGPECQLKTDALKTNDNNKLFHI